MTPPPLGKAVNGNAPGDSVHIDYISIRNKEGILVIKDGFSCWTMLWYAEEFDGPTTERALIHWAAIFGVPKIIVSDGGSHFNNNLVKALIRRFRARHHITTPYSPWANGAVERVMREVIRLFRVLMAELAWDPENWSQLIPLVMAILNRTPSDSLGRLTPSEIMLARRVLTPLDTVAFQQISAEEQNNLLEVPIQVRLQNYFDTAAAAMHASWLRATEARAIRRQQNEDARERAAGRMPRVREARDARKVPQFVIGEFVLLACPTPRNKLRIKWLGPYRVVDTVNEWVYVLENVVTLRRLSAHVQRLRIYADSQLNITEDIKNQAAYDDKFFVQELVDWREDDDGRLQLRVSWLGFTASEDTWEPIQSLHEDQPDMVEQYLRGIQAECILATPLLESLGSIHAGAAAAQPRRRRPAGGRARNKEPERQRNMHAEDAGNEGGARAGNGHTGDGHEAPPLLNEMAELLQSDEEDAADSHAGGQRTTSGGNNDRMRAQRVHRGGRDGRNGRGRRGGRNGRGGRGGRNRNAAQNGRGNRNGAGRRDRIITRSSSRRANAKQVQIHMYM